MAAPAPPAAQPGNFAAGLDPTYTPAGVKRDMSQFTDPHWQAAFAGSLATVGALVNGGGIDLTVSVSSVWTALALLERASGMIPAWNAVVAGTPEHAVLYALGSGFSVHWARGADTDIFQIQIKPSAFAVVALVGGANTVDVTKGAMKGLIGAAGRDGSQADFAAALVLLFKLHRGRLRHPILAADLEDFPVLAETWAIAKGDTAILKAAADRAFARDQELVAQDPTLQGTKFRSVERARSRLRKNALAIIAAATKLGCFT